MRQYWIQIIPISSFCPEEFQILTNGTDGYMFFSANKKWISTAPHATHKTVQDLMYYIPLLQIYPISEKKVILLGADLYEK